MFKVEFAIIKMQKLTENLSISQLLCLTDVFKVSAMKIRLFASYGLGGTRKFMERTVEGVMEEFDY